MNEVSKELHDLINMELPPREDKVGRAIVKWTVLCLSIAVVAGIGGLVFALWESLSREDALLRSNECFRQSTLIYDDAIANGVKLSVELKVEETLALAAVVEDDAQDLAEAVSAARIRIIGDGSVDNPGADAVLRDIDAAVAARRLAVDKC